MTKKTNFSTDNKTRSFFRVVPNSKNTGIFKLHGSSGFIEGTDLYVRSENINSALNKDTVEYIVLENLNRSDEKKNKFEAQITKVLDRYKIDFVGEIIHKEKSEAFILLDNSKLNRVVTTPPTSLSIGEKVKITLTNFDLNNLRGKIQKTLGNKSDLNMEIISVLEDFNVSHTFPEKVKKSVEKINLDIENHKKNNLRKDYTKIPFVTIDPTDSKDFDDAISIIKKDNIYLLYVAIADVWTYIRNHPEVTEEASYRATSIYFLNSVIPMLSEKLSNNFCSLVPNEERCALVLDIEISEKGDILWKTMNINPGIIKSKRRFTYDEINEFFLEKNDLKDETEDIKNSLRYGFHLYKILEKNRRDRGYILIECPETKININAKGEVESLYMYKRGDAQIMIENFMILANEGVARFCEENKIPSIYRIHEKPDTNKILEFIQEAKKIGFTTRNQNFTKITQKLIGEWFEDNKDNVNLDLISLLLLKSLQKAKYSINNLGHFGLNLNHYLHFTSPIRRYPDTLVHKMLWKYAFEKKPIPTNPKDPDYKELTDMSNHCTNQEILASEISREIESIKLIKYMNSKLEKTFKARVTSSMKSISFIKLEDIGVEGFVKNKYPLTIGNYLLVKPMHDTKEFKLIKVL